MTPTPEQFAVLLDAYTDAKTRDGMLRQTKLAPPAKQAVLDAYAQALDSAGQLRAERNDLQSKLNHMTDDRDSYAQARAGGAIREMSCDSPMAAEGGDGRRLTPTELQTPSPFEQSLIGEPGGNNKQPLPKGLQDISPIARGGGEWVMVPREPTPEMIEAGLYAPWRGHPETGTPTVRAIYNSMLAASPSPAQEAVEQAVREAIERCAKVCEAISADNMKQDHVYSGDGDERFLYIATGARACIKAIRALSAARGEGAG